MITLKKLDSMQDKVCVKKCAIIMHDAALSLDREQPVDLDYLRSLSSVFHMPKVQALLDEGQKTLLASLEAKMANQTGKSLAFTLEDVSSLLFASIGSEPSDWDFTAPSGALDKTKRIVKPYTLVIDRIRSPFNVGSIFRTADSFGISEIVLVEGTASVTHPRCLRTARGTTDTVAHRVLSEEGACAFLQGKQCFALELGGEDLSDFVFPKEGVCVIGSEEMGISPSLLSLCDHSLGRVSIEMYGTKGSLNVSVATGIMLYCWN